MSRRRLPFFSSFGFLHDVEHHNVGSEEDPGVFSQFVHRSHFPAAVRKVPGEFFDPEPQSPRLQSNHTEKLYPRGAYRRSPATGRAMGSMGSLAQLDQQRPNILDSLAQSRMLEPKVMLPYEPRPDQTPRKIEIERRKRIFADNNIAELIEKQGVKVSDDGETVSITLNGETKTAKPYLPLEWFDDETYEERSLEDWIFGGSASIGEAANKVFAIPCKVCIRGKWNGGYAVAYDFESNVWKVKWALSEDAKVTEMQESWLPRIAVLFLAENPYQFAKRVTAAHRLRAYTESMVRYQLCIECMPILETDIMSVEEVESIMRRVQPADHEVLMLSSACKSLLREVQANYAHTCNQMVFENQVKRGDNGQVTSSVDVPNEDYIPPVIRRSNYVDCPPYDFEQRRKEFVFNTLYSRVQIIQIMTKFRIECEKLLSMNVFYTNISKTMRLDEFEVLQNQSLVNFRNHIRDNWLVTLKQILKVGLREIGKGWFNINESNIETYRISKLARLMTMVRFVMQDTMRTLTQNTVQEFVKMFGVLVSHKAVIAGASNVTFVERPVTDPLHFDYAQKKPLFLLDMTVKQGVIVYSLDFAHLKEVLFGLYNKIFTIAEGLPQLEPLVVEKILWVNKPQLEAVSSQEVFATRASELLKAVLNEAEAAAQSYYHQYDKYAPRLSLDLQKFSADYDEENHALDELERDLVRYLQEAEALDKDIPSHINLGMFWVNCEPLRSAFRKDLSRTLLDLVTKRASRHASSVGQTCHAIQMRLRERPTTVEEMASLREYIKGIPEVLQQQREKINEMLAHHDLLERHRYDLMPEDFRARWNAYGWPARIEEAIANSEVTLKVDEGNFLKALKSDQESFSERLRNLNAIISTFHHHKDLDKIQDIVGEVQKVVLELKDCQQSAQLFNSRERIFGLETTKYDEVAIMTRDFESFKTFWTMANDWLVWKQQWTSGDFAAISPDDVEKNMNAALKVMVKSTKTFKEVAEYQALASKLKQEVEDFKPNLPLIQALRNPGMKDRHWTRLSDEIKMTLNAETKFTLKELLDKNIMTHIEVISKICDVAGKEFSIESALDKMESEWRGVVLELISYRETGTFICKLAEETTRQLEDHIVMTQSMSFSPFKKPFAERITIWDYKLRMVQDVLDALMECQRGWLYLEPIFSSEDITRQLPVESKKFSGVDRTWRRAMSQAKQSTGLIEFCSDSKLFDVLKDCNRTLEAVSKGLSAYLDSKRLAFPRFFFLSDDELLQIMSQTKNPEAVQPHLRKCFENIARLTFSADGEITAMSSADGETVQFSEAFHPQGNVEEWLLRVESVMKKSINSVMARALVDYLKTPRKEWVQQWPGQVVIAGSQTYWTKEVTEAIQDRENGGLPALHGKLRQQLEGLIELVRGDLPPITRLIIGDLIVIDVHARDVVQRLIEAKVETTNDFEWISQLRYYWQEDDLAIKIVNATFKYGYEYLGNTGRLVITPLTDRCYLTLCMAMSLNMGGAPAGPAGTGKTETVKDLAKALAKQCVVFNCSDQLDYLAMAKFFKGLASAGAWACFDEFNRIDIEVLSVIAQQITTIHKAIAANLSKFMFEGIELNLDPTNAIFITMNPGYAGRTELPDNLKALFRGCAMMIPDYTMIAEISLISFGFSNARVLAQKMVATFKLSSEQLSSQDHYDFGMRAVKTVISSAGNLKRQNQALSEDLILLRALVDCNLPKFLAEDVPLFNGILSDLFPGVKRQVIDYGNLTTALKDACAAMGLQAVEHFLNKCIQLYETTVVRHGLMLVGPTGGGKTSCARVLAQALTSLKGYPTPSGANYQRVSVNTVNPKSITMGQLYGEFDQQTHEWTDGIISTLVREGVADTSDDYKWYIFDGPVDAIWIESMNTVLDDNKKLCLSSGEIIKLVPSQKMIFEVGDLAYASPATVSRCGMVYMEPGALGVQVLIDSWMQVQEKTLAPQAFASFSKNIAELLSFFLEPSMEFTRKNVKEAVATTNSNLTRSLLKIFDSLAAMYRTTVVASETPIEYENLGKFCDCIFTFALVWSVGATSDSNGRTKFNEYLRKKLTERPLSKPMPSEGMVYDYKFDVNTNEWSHWMTDVPVFSGAKSPMVNTIDTVRYSYLLEILSRHGNHMLCIGPTGTGKSLVITEKILKGMESTFVPLIVNFSARTSANQTQDFIDSKVDKRRKGVFGPPVGKKMIIFIDDLNMPAVESTGAQPPLELVRQWMDHSGWYDRKQIGRFNELVDIMFVAAMGPPGGGRNHITNRLTRHFNYVSFVEMDDDSVFRIFSTIFDAFLEKNCASLRTVTERMTRASISIYNTIRRELLPTPIKSHYTFNLRDLSKVFRGMLSAEPKNLIAESDVIRLWSHECLRVFQDRLVDQTDRDWFSSLLKTTMKTTFNAEWSKVVTTEPLLYGDYLVPGADPKSYQEVKDLKRLVKLIDEYLDDYNSSSSAPMKLVTFLDAVEHLSRICRIIRQPFGHALLLGVGGSGRQSLGRLATFMEDFDLHQIEISKNYGMNEWKEDLKKVLLLAGLEAKPVVFLLADTQIISEACLEDVNNILNSGDVPNLYNFEEMDRISNGMKSVAQDEGIVPTKENLFSIFINRVKQNLHVVLCMSPLGEAFRNRLRMFPSLVNCCTIDWYSMWPEEALRSVAANSIAEINDIGSELIVEGIIDQFVLMHESVRKKCIQYKAELNRHNYVTPKSYLELLLVFRKLLDIKRTELNALRKRTATGLEKLLSATKEVEILSEELNRMQPMLLQTSQETEFAMKQIAVDKVKAEEIRAVIVKEEGAASIKAEETKAIADDAKRDLDEALPALDAALESLKCLTKNDVIEVRSMQRPPDGVKLVIEAVCIMKGIKPKKIDGDKGKKVDDYWEPGKTLLSEPAKFLESLMNFDKDNIAESVIQKIKPYIDNPDFQPAAIARVSKASTSMCQWVRAMEKFYHVSRSVEPKRQRLAEAQSQLEVTMKNLAELKSRMREAENNIREMEKKYAESVAKKEELGRKVEECNVKLSRAEKLIVGLGNERLRWAATVEQLDARLANVIGDVVVASGFVAYLGAFTSEYRADLIKEWTEGLVRSGLPHSNTISLMDVLGNSLKIRQWEMFGLPKDSLSRDNAIVVQNARRWPLFIDPQGQANKWIRNMEKDASLDIIKLTDRDFLRTLENCIRFGKPCLLENIGEKLDPALEPVLLRQTFKQGSTVVIKLGDSIIPHHDDFRFYMTTKLPNPHYSPETSASVTIVNFTLAPSGLEDQLLALVVANERPDLEEAKNNLMVSNANMKKELKDIEDKVLFLLSSVQGSPVDDERLIETLAASKVTSEEIQTKVKAAEKTEVDIDRTRNLYVPVAVRTRILFFCITELSTIDPMYQYSLAWFMQMFSSAISNSEKSDVVETRVKNLNDYFTFSLYSNVCRSLFERHKLLFAFLLGVKILMNDNLVNLDEWKFLLAGGTSIESSKKNPASAWLNDRSWEEVLSLSALPNYAGVADDFSKYSSGFQAIFDSPTPEKMELPGTWQTSLSRFQKLLVLKCLRPDRLILAVQDFIAATLGTRFTEPQTGDLAAVYKESGPMTSIIFVLSAGADPANNLYKFAEEMRFSKRMMSISLGQGQGPRAEALLRDGMDLGQWVLLQNCHLSPSWMPTLDKILDSLTPDKVHREFRLWLTSMPTEKFPVAILQNGLKVTVEPPSGIKANLFRTYSSFNEDYLASPTKQSEWKKLLFSLSFYHAIVQERRKFGALGWNIPYEFSDGDLRICMRQLKIFLTEYEEVPYKVLKYTAGEINYGGRVTDDWDRRLMMTVLEDFYNANVVSDEYLFSKSPLYKSIPAGTLQEYRDYIRQLPLDEGAEVFSMDNNANITFAQKEAFTVLETLLALMPRSVGSGTGKSREDVLLETAQSIMDKVPKPFDLEAVMRKYPTDYKESMSTVLVQEIIRYNRLLSIIHETLPEVVKALKGIVVMSEALEKLCNSLFINAVPALWSAKAYPSLKPLSSWVSDLAARIQFLQTWIDKGIPSVFWISGFFFPQAFLTGVLQNFARKYTLPIDQLQFDFTVVNKRPEELTKRPDDGCYIRGMYLEGARWDAQHNCLSVSRPKELYADMPVIWLLPKSQRRRPTEKIYYCPVYKTLLRAGTLSTTGHSTNYVLTIDLPSEEPQSFWIKRGVALVCSLNF